MACSVFPMANGDVSGVGSEPSGNLPPTVAAARNGVLVIFAVNGFSLASWMAHLPDIKATLSLSPSQLGLMLLAISAGALVGLPVAGQIAHRLGAARTVQLGMALVVPGLLISAIAVALHAPYYLVMPSMFMFGLGNGIWDVSQNLEGTVVERALDKAIMPWFHAAFSGGTVVGALVGALVVWLRTPIVFHIGVVVAFTAIVVLWGTRQFLSNVGNSAEESDAQPHTDGRSAWLEPRTLLVGVMVLAAAFTEGTANDWMAVAFVDGYDLEPALGVVALAVFLTFMTAGRVLGTGLLDRYGRVPLLRVLFASTLVGCLLVVFGGPTLAFVGVAIWGVGASMGFPVGMSAAADDPSRAHARLSVVSTIGYAAFLGGPPLLGLLGDHFGVQRALLVVGLVSVFALLVVPAAEPLPEQKQDA